MKILIRCVKAILILSFIIGLCIWLDYLHSTSDRNLLQNHWLLRTMNHPACTDTYILTNDDLKNRNQYWTVQYRFIDVILTLRTFDGGVKCDYASK